MSTTYEICGCGTVTVDVDVLSLNRTARKRFLDIVDVLEDMAGIGVTPAVKKPPEIVPAAPPRGTAGKPPAAEQADCPFGCGKRYRRSSMYKHRTVCPNRPDATTAEAFTCPRCYKQFAKRNGLAIHVKTCKAEPKAIVDDPNSTECEHCGYPMKTVFDRMRHEETCSAKPVALTSVPHPYDPTIPITGEQMLRCSQCGETYGVDELDDLERHIWDAHSRAAKPHERRPRAAVS